VLRSDNIRSSTAHPLSSIMEPAVRAHVAFEFARFCARHEIAPTEDAKGVCTMRLLQILRVVVNGEQDVERFAEATAGLDDAGFLGHRVAVSKEAIKVTLKLGDKDRFQYFETVYMINGLVEQPFILGDEGLGRNVPASKGISSLAHWRQVRTSGAPPRNMMLC
jgi:hypothetical protein